MRTAGVSECGGDNVPYIWRFTVAVALGGELFHGALPFSFYLPPVIKSLSQHHGPTTGDTCVKLRMKHKVPPRLKLLVRFSTLAFTKSVTVEGHPVERQNSSGSDEDPEYLIACQTPPWADEVPILTTIQVSYDSGVTFFPATDTPPATALSHLLAKDLSYLNFLFYPPPVVRSVIPLSADILGGSFIRLQGENLVDHGAQPTVIFESSTMSRKVNAFVEKGELRCCAPPFNVGLARVFVSLNGDQYTLCELREPETNAPQEFIFYSSPTVTKISPVCACVRQSSELKIFGTNLIETGRIKVRVSFPANAQGSGRRLLFKDVPGTARDGVITAMTPIFPEEYSSQNALVDVALNGADFSGTSVPLRYFSKYAITRIDPAQGAFEVPVVLTVSLTPVIVTDKIHVRVRLGVMNETTGKEDLEIVHGPVEANNWTASSVEFMVPPLNTLVDSLSALTTAQLDVSFDGVFFHCVGNLRDHYHVYNMPQLTSATPLFGVSDRETRIVAHGVHMKPGDVVKLTLFLESTTGDHGKARSKGRRSTIRATPVPVTTVIAEVNVKRQRLSWTCPSLIQLRATTERQFAPLVAAAPALTNGMPDRKLHSNTPGGMLLPERVTMQISVVDGQPTSLPFVFRFYRAATLVAMHPRVGYVCSGSLVSFEFAERIATTTVDFRFGESIPMSGRIRDERFVECFSPELTAGTHNISISFNEQHYEPAVLVEQQPDGESQSSAAMFHTYALPVFVLPPAGRERVYAFGPTSGGTVVVIKGRGFVLDTKIYVRFASAFKDAFDGEAEVIVGAKVVDNETIRCISPPSTRLGRAALHVSYNLQQFSDSTCFFEYHAPTRYVARGALCGPISGQTPLNLFVEDTKGLPSITQLLHCVVRFESEKCQVPRYSLDIEAQFDPETRLLSCITPPWPSNELVALRVSLVRGEAELFEDTRIKFLFYDPPEGVIKIEPAAGPVCGGTEVLAWCGSIVETGEITVSIQLSKDKAELSKPSILVRGEIVGEAVRFEAPPVDGPCTAVLSISLNGINYTLAQTPLRFTYYVEPILRRVNPGWAAIEGANDALVIEGENIRDFNCQLLVRFSLQDEKEPQENRIVVQAQFLQTSGTGDGALQCVFPAAPPGFYEVEVSLNGQQFTRSLYVSKTFGNLSGTACTALLPFRYFSSPFCLATATGPAAGGSSVVLFIGGKLMKIFSREFKCQVQFTPIRGAEKLARLPVNSNGISPIKLSTNVAEVTCMLGEIDHLNSRVTCRAPLLRVACVSNVDIMLPVGAGASSACQLLGIRQSEREKYYSYESPSITEIAPSCGPTSGGTQLVIEGANILDTAQIFVRFRSSLNEREFVLVPARYSRTFPGGSPSVCPLIICNTPPVEFVEKQTFSGFDATGQGTAQSSHRREAIAVGKARTHTYQMLAEQSLKAHRACASDSEGSGLGTLKITRPSTKATPRGSLDVSEGGATVLVDFTLNAGEQFIAHSVRFQYYQDIDPRQVKWSPRHLPTQCLSGRQATDSRLLTVTLPKTVRLADSPERVCFRFESVDSNPISAIRRRSFVSLQETNSRTELAIPIPAKLPRQSTMRRPSTYFKNSILAESATPPMTPRTEDGGRRPALGAPGVPMNAPATPDQGSSSRPATAGSSPCIAAKVISANEVTCSVPEFSNPGSVQVFFSPNAQQFVCLGELLFHPAMTIRDDFHRATIRFCSNVGGGPFALQVSPSTVLRYLAPEDITTVEKKHEQIQNLGLRKCSVALENAKVTVLPELKAQEETTINEDGGEEETDQAASGEDDKSESEEDDEEPLNLWQKRSFYSVQVIVVPANVKILKRVAVVATRVDNQSEVGSVIPDDTGSCVFDMSNWSEQVLLTAAVPSSCGYSSYSSVIEPFSRSNSEMKTHLVLVQLPTTPKLGVTLIGPSAIHFSLLVIDGSGDEVTSSAITLAELEVSESTRAYMASVDASVLLDSGCDVCYACVKFDSTDNEFPGSNDQDKAKIQALVLDSSGVQVCLCGSPVDSNVWIVGRLSLDDSTPLFRTIEAVDILVSDSTSSGLKDALTPLAVSPKRSSIVRSRAYFVPVTFDFTSAESSRSITASSRARLVLSASDNLQTLLALSMSPQMMNGPTVTLECSMPRLSFSGTATLVVSCGGVVFSNSVLVHCYDPRSWKVISLSPPCGQLPAFKELQETITLRFKGQHFVENRKIVVRVSDKERFFTVPGKVDQVHVLSLRIAAVKNLRSLLQPLGIVPQASSGLNANSQKKEEKYLSSIVGGTTAGGSIVAVNSTWTTFTFTLRIECGDQKLYASCREVSVLAAISSGSVLSWEEEFEIRIAADRRAPLLLTADISEPSLPKPLELAQAWVPLTGIQEGSSEIRRYTARFEEHFKRGNYIGNEATAIGTEVDLLLQLSPLMQHPDFIVAQIPSRVLHQLSPQALDVEVSSGDGIFSVPNSFLVYKPPTVTQTTPSVLPRTAGGDVVVTGTGFVDSGRVCVRLFAFKKNRFKNQEEEQRALALLNRVKRFQRTESTNDGFFPYFARDVEGIFLSSSSCKFRMPPFLTSFNVYYSVSFDGRSFTEASPVSSVLMFSISTVAPKGGPISGNTYATLHGTNIDACLSLRTGLVPLVRVTWKRGARDLENVVVPGEFYPHEDAVYFYSPQSKFGLYSIAVNVELALSFSGDTNARFGRDEVSFVMYKTPVIKSVAPLTALISGLSTTTMIVQGFDEKAVSNMRLAPKLRFKRRGQMQVSDAQLASESRFECIVPRFNVTNATATELPVSVLSGFSPVQRLRNQGALSPRRLNVQPKLWTRTAGIFVALLNARNLRASKKNACNPFAVIYVGKMQLKSTRKDGAFSPVWNELFDFEWPSSNEATSLASVRVVLENQLTADQSESLGHIQLTFPVKDNTPQAFSLRAILPLRRIRGKYYKEAEEIPVQQSSKPKKPVPASSLGEIELAIAFVPPVTQPKKPKKALRSSLISVISTHPSKVHASNHLDTGQVMFSSKKEKLLRAFRQRGAPVSLVPTELAVELALNGQDFWSVAPSTCYSVLTPIVVEVEPKFICISGGSTLSISGNNFVNSGSLRVAFAVLTDDGGSQKLNSQHAVLVEAKFRSSTCLVCTTPPLIDLASDTSCVNIYVSLNGSDFDSIALPKQLTKIAPETSVQVAATDDRLEDIHEMPRDEPPRKSPRRNAENDGAITVVSDQYVVDHNKLISISHPGENPTRLVTSKLVNFLLVPQIRVFLAPKVTRVRPTDGVYTSHLTFDGTNFTNTGIATARFTSQAVEPEIRTAKLVVISSTRMECSVPEFPRGVIVRISVAMNGLEFVQCPGELRVFQSPKLTELFPNWVSAATTLELELRGINLTAAISATEDNNRGQETASIQVSFSGSRGKKVVRGVCEDGQVRCAIPREILHVTALGREKAKSQSTNPPILVDIWLGGKHNAFTGSPLPLHVYREIPTVHLVSPMDGPVYGGFAIVVEGRGFIDTGKIMVRFQLYTEQQESTPRSEDEKQRASGLGISPGKELTPSDTPRVETQVPATESGPSCVDVVAKFVSPERILVPAPSFPSEGVYTVLVALNSVEFSRVSDGSWFLAWQNWQKRKRLLSHALFSRASVPDEAASAAAIAGAAAASASLHEDDIERLRRKSSFMLPKIRSALAATPDETSSASFKARGIGSVSEKSDVSEDTEENLMKNPRLLQWRPTASLETRVSGRPLLSLLEYLCSVQETQQLICLRLRVAFRLTRDGSDSKESSAFRFPLFVEAIRLVFPNASMRELEELWHAADHRPDGTMTIKQLERRLLRNAAPGQRSKSPEPGPTHYAPKYSIVTSRESAAIIFPPVVQPEHIVDPPSTLFIDYDAAVQAVKPRPPRQVFRKRKFNTSWCNPVVEEASKPNPRPPSEMSKSRPSPRSTSVLPSEDTTKINADGAEPQTSEPGEQASKEDAIRTPRTLPQAAIDSSNKRTRSPPKAKAEDSAVSLSPTNASSMMSRQANLSGSNPFYNDIAPLYAKFLNSTEVKRFLKQ
ncbi:hypothetical protein DVH05_011296 [Phytophthora capsici]|nr:hypothetical protein DVH05_011296 [Phytophthora capsici]